MFTEDVLRKPVLIVADCPSIKRRNKKAFKDMGFLEIETLLHNNRTIMQRYLVERSPAIVVLDTFNDFERVGSVERTKTIGRTSGGRAIHTSFHTGGHSNEEVKYGVFEKLLGIATGNSTRPFVVAVAEGGDLGKIRSYAQAVNEGENILCVEESAYVLEQVRGARRSDVVHPRKEFFDMLYQGLSPQTLS